MTDTNTTKSPAATPAHVLVRTRRGRFLLAACWLYAGVVLTALGMVRWLGGEFWGAAVVLFGPRWLFLVPIAVLAIFALIRRASAAWFVLAATAFVVLGPLMGLNLPLSRGLQSAPEGQRLRIATYNLAMEPLPAPSLVSWLDSLKIDVVCFQEGSREEDAVRKQLKEDGWKISRNRSVASRFPIVSELPPLEAEFAGDERYSAIMERVRVKSRGGLEFVVASVHLPTIRMGFERLFEAQEVSALRLHQDWWRKQLARVLSALAEVNDAPLLVAGDFNMPSDDLTLAALQSNFRFAFEEAGWGYGYTRPSNRPWVRIDHILTGPDWWVVSCHVGPDLGSDHLPLWAELVLPK